MQYYAQASWYEPDLEAHNWDSCASCSEQQEDLQGAAYWMKSILQRMYNEPWDQGEFETDLDELCSVLGVSRPKKKITLTLTQ